jgi:hypothetical protein
VFSEENAAKVIQNHPLQPRLQIIAVQISRRRCQWRLRELHIAGRALAGTPVSPDVEGYPLTFGKAAQTRTLNGADVNEHILAAIIRLDEAIALCAVAKLHCACGHCGASLRFAAFKAAAFKMI